VHGHDKLTPELEQILQRKHIGAVLMLRDPRDQVVSRLFHIRRDPSHVWHARMRALSDDEALMACIEGREGLPGVRDMINLTRSWLVGDAKALCVRYEELLSRPGEQLRRVFEHLDIPASEGLLEAVVQRNRFERLTAGRRFWKTRRPGQEDPSSHFRKGIQGDWRHHFQPRHVQGFKLLAGAELLAMGYEQDEDWSASG
jgi:hypothetical protein